MKNKNRVMPMLIAGTVLAAGVYALGRVATRVRQTRIVAHLDVRSLPQLTRSERAQLPPDPLTLDLSDLFDGRELVAEENRDRAREGRPARSIPNTPETEEFSS